MTYQTVAQEYAAAGFRPIPVKGKFPPPQGATGEDGTVTDEKIAEWAANGFQWFDHNTKTWHTESPETANTALRPEGFITLDVDDYGDNEGAAELAALEAEHGSLPATITSTARGEGDPSRQHFYRVPEGTKLRGSAGKSIEVVQYRHRYAIVYPSIHPTTGQQYRWYDYDGTPLDGIPTVTDFEYLPDAWIEHLKVGYELTERTETAPAIDKPASATVTEERKLSVIIRWLTALPRQWAPGAGWHDAVYRSSCWLWRMVNSSKYAITEQQAYALLVEHTPTYPDWGRENIDVQWASARTSTQGQVEETPTELRPTLVPFIDAANKLPEWTTAGTSFASLVFEQPHVNTPTAAVRQRREILLEAFRAGLNPQEAVTVAWHSVVNEQFQTDHATLERVWGEAERAYRQAEAEGAVTAPSPAPAATEPAAPDSDVDVELSFGEPAALPPVVPEYRAPLAHKRPQRFEILTEDERAQALAVIWFGSRYLDWAESMVPMFNAPYHRAYRWLVLSTVLAPIAFIPNQAAAIFLNLYFIVLGESTTGKTEGFELAKRVIGQCFSTDDNPVLSGRASANGLMDAMRARDGKSIAYVRDEAHALINASKQQAWLVDLLGTVTEAYSTWAPKPVLVHKKGESDDGPEAQAFLSVGLVGIEGLMADALEDEHWRSGLLPRCVWAIGEDSDLDYIPPTVERGTDAQHVYEAMPRQWAAEFAGIKQRLTAGGTTSQFPVTSEPAALARLDGARLIVKRALKANPRAKELRPALERFWISVRKCAALVALSGGRKVVTELDMLIALEQGEEWLGNALFMFDQTSATEFTRNVDKLENFIATKAGRQAKVEAVYSYFIKDGTGKRFVDDYIMQLAAEKRIDDITDAATRHRTLRLREQEIAA